MNTRGDAIDQVPALVARLYDVVSEFESLFIGRKFTPDGHLVGSIGEVLAAHRYGLTLLPHSSQGHDANSTTGVLVEIKATQGKMVALREEPIHLLVLHLSRSGEVTEIYNGPGKNAWLAAGRLQVRNGQRSISVSKLKQLMINVPVEFRIPALHP